MISKIKKQKRYYEDNLSTFHRYKRTKNNYKKLVGLQVRYKILKSLT